MRIWLDTEFLEDGRTIELISIGMVREDGKELYYVNKECDWARVYADKWLWDNVVPHLHASSLDDFRTKGQIAESVRRFCSDHLYTEASTYSSAIEFWADYASYDWVALCQLFGKMVDLPNVFPRYCNDFEQLIRYTDFAKGAQVPSTRHHALYDARWLHKQHMAFEAQNALPGFDWTLGPQQGG